MNKEVIALTKDMELFPGATGELISSIQDRLGFALPSSYVDFLLCANGGEGSIRSSYISLWKLEDLEALNIAYGVKTFAPGFLLIGSDGGDIAYAVDMREKDPKFVELPFIGMGIEAVTYCGNDLTEFLEYIIRKETPR